MSKQTEYYTVQEGYITEKSIRAGDRLTNTDGDMAVWYPNKDYIRTNTLVPTLYGKKVCKIERPVMDFTREDFDNLRPGDGIKVRFQGESAVRTALVISTSETVRGDKAIAFSGSCRALTPFAAGLQTSGRVLDVEKKKDSSRKETGSSIKRNCDCITETETTMTDFKREDFHVGDTITYYYTHNQGKIKTATLTEVDPVGLYTDNIWAVYYGDYEPLYPFSHDGCPKNITVLSISHPSAEDEWEEILNIGDGSISAFDEFRPEGYYEPINPNTISTVFENNSVRVYRMKSHHKPCDLRGMTGYFMLMDNKTHKWHSEQVFRKLSDDTVQVSMNAGKWWRTFDASGLPSDTFAVKPDAGIFLKTMNGEM